MPLGAEPGRGHAVPLDAQPVPRLHPRLPLLFRPALPRSSSSSDAGDEFATGDFREDQLARRPPPRARRDATWTRELVALGTATDPYQPIEGHYKLTRRSLEALGEARTPVGLVTKGPMVVRDADVLTGLAAAASCTVYLSVPSVDEDAWRRLEPGTARRGSG